MDTRGLRVAAVAVVVVVLAAVAVIAVRATGGVQAARATERAAARVPCARALLLDWADGRIDRTYPLACYRAALRSLPPDLEIYSSAPEDIAQALSQRIVQGVRGRPGAGVRRAAG
jgi:hypothetical protein